MHDKAGKLLRRFALMMAVCVLLLIAMVYMETKKRDSMEKRVSSAAVAMDEMIGRVLASHRESDARQAIEEGVATCSAGAMRTREERYAKASCILAGYSLMRILELVCGDLDAARFYEAHMAFWKGQCVAWTAGKGRLQEEEVVQWRRDLKAEDAVAQFMVVARRHQYPVANLQCGQRGHGNRSRRAPLRSGTVDRGEVLRWSRNGVEGLEAIRAAVEKREGEMLFQGRDPGEDSMKEIEALWRSLMLAAQRLGDDVLREYSAIHAQYWYARRAAQDASATPAEIGRELDRGAARGRTARGRSF